jgi:hypothetical protein
MSEYDPGFVHREAWMRCARRANVNALLEEHPNEVALWVGLSHALLQEGTDWDCAELALRRVLELDPDTGKRGATWRCWNGKWPRPASEKRRGTVAPRASSLFRPYRASTNQ